METAIGAEAMKRFGTLDEMMSARHPAEPHWYLPFIGVHPDHHGKGVGSALLRDKLAELDQAGTAAYLEASSPRNAALYERLGFRRRPVTLDLPEGPALPDVARPVLTRTVPPGSARAGVIFAVPSWW
ncbi:GNAT family N-acetyltransferase [Micromonospora sp. BRA006-A]|nr:GNAT family N-acetyltransferase [Micromonospora sp. BRA006-A]